MSNVVIPVGEVRTGSVVELARGLLLVAVALLVTVLALRVGWQASFVVAGLLAGVGVVSDGSGLRRVAGATVLVVAAVGLVLGALSALATA